MNPFSICPALLKIIAAKGGADPKFSYGRDALPQSKRLGLSLDRLHL